MNDEVITSNKRIVKNTLVLYLRMFLVLIVSLYTSRVVLNSLGVTDFGIYNVVGSIVAIFAYMNSALSLATIRFLSYEMPYGVERMRTVFNTSVKIQFVFAFVIVLLAETIGLWLVNNKLVIPSERLTAANWVYQFSVISTVISIVGVTFNSTITSHEKMSVYALISINESILKLIIALLIASAPIDRLVFYGSGILIVTAVSFFIMFIYCRKKFEEIEFKRTFNKQLFKKMFAFVGWNFFGATAGMSVGQGLNFIINIFFGPAVNAARGIAFQIEGAVVQFVTNINTAINPQIVKRYSLGDTQSMFNLVFFASKLSFLLLLFISLPIIIDTPYILKLWLNEVPEQTILFTRLILLYMLTISVTYSVNMSAQASGNIKWFQIAEGSILLLNIPAAIIMYNMGMEAFVSFVAMIVLSITAFVVKLAILYRTIGFPVKSYVSEVVLKLFFISMVCIVVYIVSLRFESTSLAIFFVKSLFYLAPFGLLCLFVGFKVEERVKLLHSFRRFAKQFCS